MEKTFEGGCHCGAVRYRVHMAVPAPIQSCNCSICSKTAFLHMIVPKARFQLLGDPGALSCYTFNTGIAQHYFCKTCGVKSFYVPRSNPDGYSVNVRCLDAFEASDFRLEAFDGKNWEAHADALAHLSRSES